MDTILLRVTESRRCKTRQCSGPINRSRIRKNSAAGADRRSLTTSATVFYGSSGRRGPQTESAVHGQNLTGHVAAGVAGQKDDHFGNVVGLADAAHRDELLDQVAGLVPHRLAHV